MKSKGMNVAQAQRWLLKLKESDPACFREFSRCLKRYDQTFDELDCFVRMNEVLALQPKMTQELNSYLEEGNKMFFDPGLNKRLETLVLKIEQIRPEKGTQLEKIIQDCRKRA